MIIREGTIQDARAIAEVHVSSWRTTYVGQMPQSVLDNLSVESREAMWSTILNKPTHGVLVADSDGAVVGFASFGPSRDDDASSDTGELYAIYLTEESKGAGIGTALWARARNALIARGCSSVMLWVLDTNTRARRFYEQMGFRLDGTEKRQRFGERECGELRYSLSLR